MLVATLVAAAVFAMLAWHRSLPAIDPPPRSSFEPASVTRGSRLAAIGNCAGCHTTAEGMPYAGGVPVRTPFGTIHGTNLTPDVDTGIGGWSKEAFVRAMRQGVARDGRQLYPVFPYDHFTRIVDADLGSLYAFLMTRDPVRAEAPVNDLRFPFNLRPLVAGWNLLYLDRSPVPVDRTQSDEWNRGAYLAESLAHCSACHSPRNALGAERMRHHLAGGEADGWYAPALDATSPSPVPWDVSHLTAYLRTGLVEDHAIAGGPMQGVAGSLAQAPEADVRAIAVYIVSKMGPVTRERSARARAAAALASGPLPSDEPRQPGARIYADACASCHDAGRRPGSGGALPLSLAVAVHDPDPRSLIRIVREGIMPPPGGTGRWMPPFAGSLTDGQTTELLAWLRQQAAGAPPWPDLSRQVARASKEATSP